MTFPHHLVHEYAQQKIVAVGECSPILELHVVVLSEIGDGALESATTHVEPT